MIVLDEMPVKVCTNIVTDAFLHYLCAYVSVQLINYFLVTNKIARNEANVFA